MLDGSMFTVIGVIAGVGYALKARGTNQNKWRPFVKTTSAGALADLVQGYAKNCRQLIDDYEQMSRLYNRK